nr:MAG TPA: hypothetical protein [Caudoviricetes sp.]
MSNTRFYEIWASMKKRCLNSKSKAFKNYGARGITVCDRWKDSFENFKEDMYESYLKHCEEFGEMETTLDRIDNNGNYCKENCRWATHRDQMNNVSYNRFVSVDGETLTVAEASRKYKINYGTILHRINSGKDIFGNKQ